MKLAEEMNVELSSASLNNGEALSETEPLKAAKSLPSISSEDHPKSHLSNGCNGVQLTSQKIPNGNTPESLTEYSEDGIGFEVESYSDVDSPFPTRSHPENVTESESKKSQTLCQKGHVEGNAPCISRDECFEVEDIVLNTSHVSEEFEFRLSDDDDEVTEVSTGISNIGEEDQVGCAINQDTLGGGPPLVSTTALPCGDISGSDTLEGSELRSAELQLNPGVIVKEEPHEVEPDQDKVLGISDDKVPEGNLSKKLTNQEPSVKDVGQDKSVRKIDFEERIMVKVKVEKDEAGEGSDIHCTESPQPSCPDSSIPSDFKSLKIKKERLSDSYPDSQKDNCTVFGENAVKVEVMSKAPLENSNCGKFFDQDFKKDFECDSKLETITTHQTLSFETKSCVKIENDCEASVIKTEEITLNDHDLKAENITEDDKVNLCIDQVLTGLESIPKISDSNKNLNEASNLDSCSNIKVQDRCEKVDTTEDDTATISPIPNVEELPVRQVEDNRDKCELSKICCVGESIEAQSREEDRIDVNFYADSVDVEKDAKSSEDRIMANVREGTQSEKLPLNPISCVEPFREKVINGGEDGILTCLSEKQQVENSPLNSTHEESIVDSSGNAKLSQDTVPSSENELNSKAARKEMPLPVSVEEQVSKESSTVDVKVDFGSCNESKVIFSENSGNSVKLLPNNKITNDACSEKSYKVSGKLQEEKDVLCLESNETSVSEHGSPLSVEINRESVFADEKGVIKNASKETFNAESISLSCSEANSESGFSEEKEVDSSGSQGRNDAEPILCSSSEINCGLEFPDDKEVNSNGNQERNDAACISLSSSDTNCGSFPEEKEVNTSECKVTSNVEPDVANLDSVILDGKEINSNERTETSNVKPDLANLDSVFLDGKEVNSNERTETANVEPDIANLDSVFTDGKEVNGNASKETSNIEPDVLLSSDANLESVFSDIKEVDRNRSAEKNNAVPISLSSLEINCGPEFPDNEVDGHGSLEKDNAVPISLSSLDTNLDTTSGPFSEEKEVRDESKETFNVEADVLSPSEANLDSVFLDGIEVNSNGNLEKNDAESISLSSLETISGTGLVSSSTNLAEKLLKSPLPDLRESVDSTTPCDANASEGHSGVETSDKIKSGVDQTDVCKEAVAEDLDNELEGHDAETSEICGRNVDEVTGVGKGSGSELSSLSSSPNFCDVAILDSSMDEMDSQDCSTSVTHNNNSKDLVSRKRALSHSEGESCDSFKSKKLVDSRNISNSPVDFLNDAGLKRPADVTSNATSKKPRVTSESSRRKSTSGIVLDSNQKETMQEERDSLSPVGFTMSNPSKEPETLLDYAIERVVAQSAADSAPIKPVPLPVLRKFHQQELSEMSRSDLEELVLQKICEAITDRSNVGKLRLRCEELEKEQERDKEKFNSLRKQMHELSIVVKKYLDNVKHNKPSPPIRVTRSVGLQVCQAFKPMIPCPHTLQRFTQPVSKPGDVSPSTKKDASQHQTPQKSSQATSTTASPTPPTLSPILPRPVSNVVTSIDPPALIPTSTPASTAQVSMPVCSKAPLTTPRIQAVAPAPRVQLPSPVPPPLQQLSPVRPRLTVPTSQSTPNKNQLNTHDDVEVIEVIDDQNKRPATVRISNEQQQHQLKQAANAAANNPANNGAMTVRLLPPQVSKPGNTIVSSFPQIIVPSQVLPQKMIITSAAQASALRGNVKFVMKPNNGNVLIPLQTSHAAAVSSNIVQISSSTQAAVQQIFTNANIGNRTNTVATLRQVQPPSISDNSLHPAPLPTTPPFQASNPAWKLIPPRPNLKIQLQNNGIVLSWHMALNATFADIESYQLYAYQEGKAPPSAGLWKKVGDVKALPLPMACTLTQFVEGHRYHFTVRAVDKHGRVGPFSQQGSIRLGN